ncbi:MAG: methylenetetrahydrofolate--tRNA-(uracil(54)-C(5))-methyltransferase (FADH(2)-oxidizing) TrmFO [Gemmatimonadetes bacterium 13_1_40CM_2_60_3]|nr:MAG: methylenetetrahydrofolate--tRNA-(uracil(54)-C(5))-methyltransferase (FADH(2)-oxidizing) TrmFO [Gemmatimonadetes bacterium 13_1_40CM_2_60_3]
MSRRVTVVGGGLAGSEAAWQLASRGFEVVLHEMRPLTTTPAHKTDKLAELVCSNTFKSTELTNAHGLLKAEMRLLGSMILEAADSARVAAGSALAVDRDVFSATVTERIESQSRISVVRDEVTEVIAPCVIATGPLTSDKLAEALRARLGVGALEFYDAIAPIVARESIDDSIVFRGSRYGKETMDGADDEGAYLNCPMTREQYDGFVGALISADQYHGHEFDEVPYFEGCMPVEVMAKRGRDTLRFGPLKPVGLRDPRTGREAYAVVQLRQEDRAGRMWNLVGFQTRLRIPEQQRVLRMIPGLADAEFLRYGSIHRNSYLNSPAALSAHLAIRDEPTILFAGQITGVEGYTESSATGLLAGINLARLLSGDEPVIPPATTMIGALYRYMNEADPRHFQPMNANFGLLDELPEKVRDKKQKREKFAARAIGEMRQWIEANGIRERKAVEQISNNRKPIEDLPGKFAESIALPAPR